MEEINTYKQSCHKHAIAEHMSKRSYLIVGINVLCGAMTQRDLYSAYLACFVKNNELIAAQARKTWEGIELPCARLCVILNNRLGAFARFSRL